jgi:hypothetical protein
MMGCSRRPTTLEKAPSGLLAPTLAPRVPALPCRQVLVVEIVDLRPGLYVSVAAVVVGQRHG